jgi:putative hydrolase of the HAD superfamily
MLKLVIIDLDDTIINYMYAHSIAFDNLMHKISCEFNVDYNTLMNFHKNIKNKLYIDYDKQFIQHDKLLQLKLLCNELKINDVSKILELYELYETSYLSNLSLHENCIDFFKFCNSNNIRIAIMTNNTLHIQLKVCNKFNISKYIDFVLTSNEFLYEKPHTECLQYILNKYNVKNDEVLIIGDSELNDIQWGINNNIKTFLCDHKSSDTTFEASIKLIENLI